MMELLNEFLSGSVAWGVLLTLAAFALGALVNRVTGKAFFNPLLLGAIFVIVFLSVCGIPYADYKVSAAPVNYLLLPATVALAIPLYEKLDLLKANAAAIIAGISVGTLVSLGSALALALALHLTQEQYATLLPKSVTTAISMDVAAELGGIAALTGAIVILTGIVGNLLAETVCKAYTRWGGSCRPHSRPGWPRRSARRFTSPTPLPKVWALAPRPMPWAPARPCRWVRWKVP